MLVIISKAKLSSFDRASSGMSTSLFAIASIALSSSLVSISTPIKVNCPGTLGTLHGKIFHVSLRSNFRLCHGEQGMPCRQLRYILVGFLTQAAGSHAL